MHTPETLMKNTKGTEEGSAGGGSSSTIPESDSSGRFSYTSLQDEIARHGHLLQTSLVTGETEYESEFIDPFLQKEIRELKVDEEVHKDSYQALSQEIHKHDHFIKV